MDAPDTTTSLKQLPIWPLVVGTIGLGLLSLVISMAAAAGLSLVFLFAMSRMPFTATVSLSEDTVTVKGWMGSLFPLPRTRTLPRAGLIADVKTAAGEDDTYVHAITFTTGDKTARLAGVQSPPAVVHKLLASLAPADTAEAS